MQLLERFNPYDHNPEAPVGGNLPVGKHPVVITGGELTATKSQDGGMLVLTLQIIDGPHKGSEGVYRLNLYNNSEKAKKIAQNQLTALCYVTGQFQLGQNGDDASVLIGKPFLIEVGLQQDERYTEIKGVFYTNGDKPKQGGGQQNNGQQQTQNNNNFGGNTGNQGGNNWNGNNGQNNQQQPNTNNGGGGGWQGNQNNNQPQNNNSGGNNSGGWNQNNGGGGDNSGRPAWGQK